MIRFNEFKRNELYVSNVMTIRKKMFSETGVGLEMLVHLSNGLRCSLKRSLSRRLVSPMYCL